ncbi:MAG: excinuclease ABC subunit UvrA [Candidatus Aureabacteria bacterium]|nr:excinuclease ABC subunit UvrA [Candidatus Auribacterota bacterium]
MFNEIKVIGARENNLKNLNVTIPRDKFVVLTGVSGSGKSSLAFDTVYAEGQRRYVESLSTHARQFLNQMNKPDVDSIEGLSPSISIQQRVAAGSPRSTVGTTTEIYDYLRLLFARIGQAFCYKCGTPIHSQTNQEIVDQIMKVKNGEMVQILAPVIKGKKGNFISLIKDLQKAGFVRARVDGKVVKLSDELNLKKNLTHDIEVIVDRLVIKEDITKRLSESVGMALNLGKGLLLALFGEKKPEEVLYSELNACPDCGISVEALTPSLFSFNSPYGACELCHGLGVIDLLDPNLMVVDEDKTIAEGAIPVLTLEDVPMIDSNKRMLEMISNRYKIDLSKTWRDWPEKHKQILMDGSGEVIKTPFWRNGQMEYREVRFEGFRKILFDRFQTSQQTQPKEIIRRYMSSGICPFCKGKRLKPESLAVRIDRFSIIDITEQPIEDLFQTFQTIKLSTLQQTIGREVIKEILLRLEFLNNVGLGYLTLSRPSNTLAGGEAQRIKLATQIGSGLMGVLYVLDEPSIGLHYRDNGRLLQALQRLKVIGNSVLVVEHDEQTIASAEYVIEMGPDAGVGGGHVIFQGTLDEMLQKAQTKTAKYLRRELKIPVPEKRRPFNHKSCLTLTGCTENNLKNITVSFPLGCMVAVSGVSGSGKSSLIHHILYKVLLQKLTRSKVVPGDFKSISGFEKLDSVIEINQSAIGRTPRSNPATYSGVFDLIRDWYAQLPESKMRGLKSTHFSFNVRGGRCEACQGDGIKKIEMHFLPDVYVPCEVCNGQRYDREILDVKYKNKSISDILNSTVEEAILDFKNVPLIHNQLKLLKDVGLSYIKLGQSATTLSGGEAQRIKLASELGNRTRGPSVYLLDEPTTGLHFADIHNLLDVLQRLVNMGHTVIIIEHNMEVIYASDYVIDLGPEGGNRGGEVVAAGTPEDIIKVQSSYTGQYLKQHAERLLSIKGE